jgi:uncharacterized iron-regulated membrane protein
MRRLLTRKALLKLHLWLAWIAGVFVVILGTTGCIMAFEPELDHLFHPWLSYVHSQPRRLSLAELRDHVMKEFPGERIAGYNLSTSPHISAQVALPRGIVFVNPYTGEILGVRLTGMTFLAYVHQLHLRLAIRDPNDPGKKIISWAGVAMLFLLLSGLILWWPLKRVTVQPGKQFWFDLHNVTGIFSFVFLLILTVTGIMIGFEQTSVPMFYKLTGSEPQRPPAIFAPRPGAIPITPDQAMEIARTALSGATPFGINAPGPKGVYTIRARFPEDLTPGGRSLVVVDQYTGTVLFSEDSRTAPAGARVVIANRAIHTGDIFGIPSKAIMSLASLMAVAQLITGVTMWWKRR